VICATINLVDDELACLNPKQLGNPNSHLSNGGQRTMTISDITAFISPFLPVLLKLGDNAVSKAAGSAAAKFGEAAFHKAQTAWNELWPKIEVKETALEAVVDVANNPEDVKFQTVLEVQFEKLFKQDQELLKLISQILQEDSADGVPGVQIVQNVIGNKNQTIGRMEGGLMIGTINTRARD
jgi:hypothetical protein